MIPPETEQELAEAIRTASGNLLVKAGGDARHWSGN